MYSAMAIGKFYILRDHEVVEVDNMLEAAEFFGDIAARTVKKTKLADEPEEVGVSTVFLTIDHSFREDGPPIVFETLVFGGPMADWMRRYATWDEAEAGHEETVALVRAALQGTKPKEDDTVVQKYERRTWHERVLNDGDDP